MPSSIMLFCTRRVGKGFVRNEDTFLMRCGAVILAMDGVDFLSWTGLVFRTVATPFGSRAFGSRTGMNRPSENWLSTVQRFITHNDGRSEPNGETWLSTVQRFIARGRWEYRNRTGKSESRRHFQQRYKIKKESLEAHWEMLEA
ncbi:hypothetical protein J6590_080630 [Homalodisca vitripennis]|nr:hypothetical protein J6590_080630 [Homalodisca vitripennis]